MKRAVRDILEENMSMRAAAKKTQHTKRHLQLQFTGKHTKPAGGQLVFFGRIAIRNFYSIDSNAEKTTISNESEKKQQNLNSGEFVVIRVLKKNSIKYFMDKILHKIL